MKGRQSMIKVLLDLVSIRTAKLLGSVVRACFSNKVLCKVELSLQGLVGREIEPASMDWGGESNLVGFTLLNRDLLEGWRLGLTLGGLSKVGVLGTPSTLPATPPRGSLKLLWKLNLRASRLKIVTSVSHVDSQIRLVSWIKKSVNYSSMFWYIYEAWDFFRSFCSSSAF